MDLGHLLEKNNFRRSLLGQKAWLPGEIKLMK